MPMNSGEEYLQGQVELFGGLVVRAVLVTDSYRCNEALLCRCTHNYGHNNRNWPYGGRAQSHIAAGLLCCAVQLKILTCPLKT